MNFGDFGRVRVDINGNCNQELVTRLKISFESVWTCLYTAALIVK